MPTTGDSFDEQELDTKPAVLFKEVGAAAVAQTIARVRSKALGPFNATRFGFDRLDLYIDRTLPPPNERTEVGSNGTLRLILVARKGSARRYWLLREDESEAAHDARRIVDPLLVDDEPGKKELVRYATGNRGVPLIDVQYPAELVGANTVATYERHLLIDVRSGTPQLMGLLQNYVIEGGGACTAYDGIYEMHTEIGCRWNDRDGGFRCTRTIHRLDTDWGERRGTGVFTFGSPRPPAEPSPAQGLRRLVEEDAALDLTPQPGIINPLGPVVPVHLTRFDGANVVVMASPLVTEMLQEPFGVRLHVAVVRAGQATEVRELKPRTSLREMVREPWATPEPPTPAKGLVPDGVLPSYRIRSLASDPRHAFLQLTVAEGTARGVYLIGLERNGERIVADAFLVATDAISYDHCNEWATEPSATAMQVTKEPFSAVLDVEPANHLHDEARDTLAMFPRPSSEPCRTTVTLEWQNGAGFRAAVMPGTCSSAEPPRRVVVGTDGSISGVLAEVASREP